MVTVRGLGVRAARACLLPYVLGVGDDGGGDGRPVGWLDWSTRGAAAEAAFEELYPLLVRLLPGAGHAYVAAVPSWLYDVTDVGSAAGGCDEEFEMAVAVYFPPDVAAPEPDGGTIVEFEDPNPADEDEENAVAVWVPISPQVEPAAWVELWKLVDGIGMLRPMSDLVQTTAWSDVIATFRSVGR